MPIRHLKFRERIRNAIDLHVATRRNIHCPLQRFRNFAEDSKHLVRRFEIELVRWKFHPALVAHRLAGLNAQQNFLGVRVFVMQVMAVVGRHQRNPGLFRKPHQMRIHTLLDLQSLILNLQKEILFSKYIAQAVCILASAIVFLFDHRFRHRTLQTRRQRNQPAAVFGEQIVVNARLVVETFQEACGDQLDQVMVTLKIFAKQHQVIVSALPRLPIVAIIRCIRRRFLSAVVPATLRHVDFAANNRLYVALACLVKKVRGRKKISVVCNRHRRHLLAGRFIQKLARLASAIEQTKIGMNVQVNELRGSHEFRF